MGDIGINSWQRLPSAPNTPRDKANEGGTTILIDSQRSSGITLYFPREKNQKSMSA